MRINSTTQLDEFFHIEAFVGVEATILAISNLNLVFFVFFCVFGFGFWFGGGVCWGGYL